MAKRKTRTALFERPVPADDVVVRCIRLGDAFSTHQSRLFAQYELTVLQYNVLRILYVRDAEGEGIPTGSIGARLLVRVPDVTRLVDRLEKAGHVERFRDATDRRVVKVRLTRAGTALVEKIHEPLIEHSVKLLAHMSEAELEALSEGLQKAFDGLA